jgi:hypothetical protein
MQRRRHVRTSLGQAWMRRHHPPVDSPRAIAAPQAPA